VAWLTELLLWTGQETGQYIGTAESQITEYLPELSGAQHLQSTLTEILFRVELKLALGELCVSALEIQQATLQETL
jgi:hypothetical protein